jgi:ferrous iron transport protein A
MTIVECERNRAYIVKKLHTSGALRQRLVSFGLLKGSSVKCLAYSAMKGTYEIQIGKMSIALRKDEAAKIEVEES